MLRARPLRHSIVPKNNFAESARSADESLLESLLESLFCHTRSAIKEAPRDERSIQCCPQQWVKERERASSAGPSSIRHEALTSNPWSDFKEITPTSLDCDRMVMN